MTTNKYTHEIIEFIKSIDNNSITNETIANLVNKRFKINTNANKIRHTKAYYKLNEYKQKNTCKMAEYVRSIANGKHNNELAKIVNEKYGTDYDIYAMARFNNRHGIKTGVKGMINSQEKPIGTEWEQNGGNIYVKIGSPDKWITKQRYIYEKHFGEIPCGYKVVFLNKNNRDFSIDNLTLLRQNELSTLVGSKMLSTNKETTKTGILVSQLICKTKKLIKGGLDE